jgi:hypothetical protein
VLEQLRARGAIRRYFDDFLELADARGLPFVLDSGKAAKHGKSNP